ncbi:MAG: Hydrogenase nickel incorporation protein HypA [Cyanobacteriota bacterium]
MHELSLMENLGERVLRAAAAEGAETVLAIRLRIGTLAGVDPEALRFAAEVVLADTIAAGATLAIEEVEPACWCEPCGEPFAVPAGWGDCPRCGTLSTRVVRGKELTLVSVELLP